jgi:membrane-associated phospholipid phosphatase
MKKSKFESGRQAAKILALLSVGTCLASLMAGEGTPLQGALAVLTLVRARLDFPRPYEVYGLEPLIPRESRGKSFPSRHQYSICVIGTSLLYLRPELGAPLLALSVLLGAARVASGVHFPKDVLVGALVGVLSAVAGFSLVP